MSKTIKSYTLKLANGEFLPYQVMTEAQAVAAIVAGVATEAHPFTYTVDESNGLWPVSVTYTWEARS